MSKSSWSVVVSVLFALATWIAPSEWLAAWRRPLAIMALTALVLSCLGWLMAHVSWMRRLRADRRATHTMTLLIIGCVSAAIGVGVWFLVPKEAVQGEKTEQNSSEPFYVRVGPTMHSLDRATLGQFSGVFEKDGQYTIVPLNVAVYVTLTNLQAMQSMVEKYGVEIKTKNGGWVRLIRVDCRNLEFYSMAGTKEVEEASQVGLILLDNQLSFRWLQSRETVKGWTFFQYPQGLRQESFLPIYRIHVVDSTGLTFSSKELTARENEYNEGVQGAVIQVLGKKRDLRGARLKYVN